MTIKHYLVYGVTKDGDNMVNDEEFMCETMEEAQIQYDALCKDQYDYVYLDSMDWDYEEWSQDCVYCWEREYQELKRSISLN
tara:strand:- start:10 stop:255 length:246 start_codon:yes stop_codon:yes gene_type:complete